MPKITFSEYFNLGKSQHELDFVDVPINASDIPLFIDPYAISKRDDRWSVHCHNYIVNFFQRVIDLMRNSKGSEAKYMLAGLREPNQTRFGLSKGTRPRGRGVGREQSVDLFDALRESTAVRTGFIKDLEDCELLIEGISRDKISDITTDIIKSQLIEYTQTQCFLFDITMKNVASGLIWDATNAKWTNRYVNLPVCNGRSVILIPKAIARFDMEFDYQEYYQHFVLNFLQSEHLHANSSLVRVLKNGTKKEPTKKSLKSLHPLSKQYLYEFSKQHPEVLTRYKQSKTYLLREISDEMIMAVTEKEPKFDFSEMTKKLKAIPVGDSGASSFHDYIKGVLTLVFYPTLINPVKELEIHEGRKRIDLVFTNAATSGFFLALSQNKQVPSAYIFIECKNYSSDPANPELDQLAGRFSVNRGKFGFLICRNLTDKTLFFKRCRDTAQDGRGLIIPLDDEDIIKLIDLKNKSDTVGISQFLEDAYKKLVM